jgi:Ca-activated chloride channel homolog
MSRCTMLVRVADSTRSLGRWAAAAAFAGGICALSVSHAQPPMNAPPSQPSGQAGGQASEPVAAAPGATAGALVIREPAEGSAVVGVNPITVSVTPADRVARVTMFVDGRELCTLERAPWSCRWDAGRDIREHHLRIVATFSSGRRVVANRRTQGIDVNEAVNVSAVQVPVLVTGPDGRFVRGLKKESFSLSEDGRSQRIETLIDESLPLELIVAVDISGSMEGAMPQVQEAVKRLLSRLKPRDTTTLLGFNDTMFVLAERETDQALRDAAVEGLVPWGGTAFYDATVKALDLVSQQAGRRGIIMFSDGDDRHSVGRRDESLTRIQEGQVVVYTVGFGEGGSEQFRGTLTAFAEASGGRAFFPRRAADLDATFDSILEELSHQYILSYVSSSPDQGGWRKLEIRASCAGCKVRAREGYRAPEP